MKLSTPCYQILTPWERLPLLVAAALRGDDVDQERLARSAPRNSFRSPDFWGLAEGIGNLAQLYLIRQLDLAAVYWRVMTYLEQGPLGRCAEDQPQEDRLGMMAKLTAYRFVVGTDGWNRFCADLHLDPDGPLRQLPGSDTLRHMEEIARLDAFTPEAALVYWKQIAERRVATTADPGEHRLDTAEDVARLMRNSLQDHLDAWR